MHAYYFKISKYSCLILKIQASPDFTGAIVPGVLLYFNQFKATNYFSFFFYFQKIDARR